MIDPRTHIEMCNAEFAAGRTSRDAEIESLREQLAASQKREVMLRHALSDLVREVVKDDSAWETSYGVVSASNILSLTDGELAHLIVCEKEPRFAVEEVTEYGKETITTYRPRRPTC